MSGKLLFAGGRLDSLAPLIGTLGETGAGVFHDGSWSDCGVVVAGTAAAIFSDPASAPALVPYAVPLGATVYVHAVLGWGDGWDGGGDRGIMTLVDAAGNPWVQLTRSGFLQHNTNYGSPASPTWVQIGTLQAFPGFYFSPSAIDIKLDLDAGHNHTILLAYRGVAAMPPQRFINTGIPNIGALWLSQGGNANYGWSEIMATENQSTVGGHVLTRRPTAAGAHADWSGTVADVNEQITNDSTANVATVANALQSYKMDTLSIPTGYIIAGVFQWHHAKNDGGTPGNIKALVRQGATDYLSADMSGLLVTFNGVGVRHDTDPATGLAWTAAGWNAGPVEFGFESDT